MRKNLLVILGLLIWSTTGYAQLPGCNNDMFYHHSGATIYNYNVITSGTSVNTITMPAGAGGLAVSNNLNGGTPSPTFYTTVGGNYYYYNGTTWVNTGHFTGNTSAVNIGGAGPYIYNLNGIGQTVYRYDGTGPGIPVLSLPGWGGPYDCIGDAAGNFYILKTNSAPYTLTMYDPNGNILCVYDLVGFPTSSAGGGYAIVNNTLYCTIGSTSCYGNIVGNTITYAGPLVLGGGTSDYANCEFPPLLVNITTPDTLTCAINSVVLNASTTLPGATWSWAGPGVVSGSTTSSPTVNAPGTYTVTVTSTGGCTSSVTSTAIVIQNGGLGLSSSTVDVLCNGASTGSIDQTLASGAPPYSFNWSNGATTEDLSGIPAGTYTVSISDNGGCSTTASYTITEPPAIVLNTSSTQATCGVPDGSATVNASGGAGGFTYLWSSGGTSATETNIGMGTYTVIVTDANSCTQTATATVGGTSGMAINSSNVVDVTCPGWNDGSINVSAGSGTPPYTYSWAPSGGTGATATNLTAGSYTVSITDGSGCTITSSFTVGTTNPTPAIDFMVDEPIGCAVHCVNFTTIPTTLQTYQWQINGQNAGSGANFNYCFNSAGLFDITLNVTDINGCPATVTKPDYISVDDYPIAAFTTDKQEYSESDAEVHIIDQSYNAATHTWNLGDGNIFNGVTDFQYNYTDTGVFCITLIVTSDLDCSDTATHCVHIIADSYFYIPNTFTPNEDGINDVFHPIGSNISKYHMRIYNRWGQEIFTSAKDDDVWSGRIINTQEIAPQGVYVYKIIVTDNKGDEHELMGHVNLIR